MDQRCGVSSKEGLIVSIRQFPHGAGLDGRERFGFFPKDLDPVIVNDEELAIDFELVSSVAAVSTDVRDGADVGLVILGPTDEFEVVGFSHGSGL
jgi:hypothetical protein